MKKLMIALICGLVWMPLAAWGQKWIPPHTAKDGTHVEGHWQTPGERYQEQYSTPKPVTPYSGQVDPATGAINRLQPGNPYLPPQNPSSPQPNRKY